MRLLPLVLASSLTAAFACSSSYTETEAERGALDAGAEASSGGSGGSGTSEDAGGDSGREAIIPGELQARCPPPPAPTLPPDRFQRLYQPTDSEYPFGVATDTRHVYWVAQAYGTSPGEEEKAYNGDGARGRIHRLRKGQPGTEAELLVDDQDRMQAIALDGDSIVWAARSGSQWELRRMRRDCTAPCSYDGPPILLPLGGDVVELLRVGEGLLVAQSEDGVTVTIENAVQKRIADVGPFPSITSTNESVTVGGATQSSLEEIDVKTGNARSIALPASTGGARLLTTDCEHVFVLGERSVGTVTAEGYKNWGLAPGADTFAMLADSKYLYFGSANGHGVFAVDKATKAVSEIAMSSAWRMTLDGDGLYWGDHNRGGVGTLSMYRTR